MTFAEKLESKLLPIASKISGNKYLMSMRDGILLGMPLIIVGSAMMIIASFPIEAFTDFLDNIGASAYLWKGVDSSFGIVALTAAFGIAQSLSNRLSVDGTPAGIISLASFITVTPFISGEDIGSGLPIKWIGSKGLFVAIILGLLTGKIYAWFVKKNIVITLPESVPPAVSRSFTALIPAAAILTGSILLAALVDKINLGNIHEILANVLGKPLGVFGGNLFGSIVMISLNSIFWFMGVHGGTIVGSVMGPIWLMLTDQNRLAFKAGTELPNIITSPFLDLFVWIGGGGATIGLAIAILFIAKNRKSSQLTKALAPITSTPSFFNINEPLMFGVPIVMNVSLLVPFIITPVMNAIISYFAMASGIVAKTTGANVPWTMPPIISGFLATRDWKASVLQLILIILDTALYYVFFRAVEKGFRQMESSAESENKKERI